MQSLHRLQRHEAQRARRARRKTLLAAQRHAQLVVLGSLDHLLAQLEALRQTATSHPDRRVRTQFHTSVERDAERRQTALGSHRLDRTHTQRRSRARRGEQVRLRNRRQRVARHTAHVVVGARLQILQEDCVLLAHRSELSLQNTRSHLRNQLFRSHQRLRSHTVDRIDDRRGDVEDRRGARDRALAQLHRHARLLLRQRGHRQTLLPLHTRHLHDQSVLALWTQTRKHSTHSLLTADQRQRDLHSLGARQTSRRIQTEGRRHLHRHVRRMRLGRDRHLRSLHAMQRLHRHRTPRRLLGNRLLRRSSHTALHGTGSELGHGNQRLQRRHEASDTKHGVAGTLALNDIHTHRRGCEDRCGRPLETE